eukprot:TRINITY_DN29641_c0_g1_i1.p1 TRINITY_DN29641_c0_g1~~TRINITY_DN29641_c0_g1_i1.p1  ORF type:complete len:489 (-),score=89.94 TRINITY_DN29641_c0_g1_i1:12-1478(-)
MAPIEAELALALPGSVGRDQAEVSRESDDGSELEDDAQEPDAPEGFPETLVEELDDRSIFLEEQKAKFKASLEERRAPMPRKEAKSAMRDIKFFLEFEEVIPGVLDELAKVTVSHEALEGEVLFRQGDPAIDCYVVLSGKVGVFVRSNQQDSPRDLEVVADVGWSTAMQANRFCCCFTKSQRMDEYVIKAKNNRGYVTECYNTFTPNSNLGTKVAELGKGSGFGELGLLDKKPRAASIKCIERSKLLVLLQEDFLRLLGDCIDAKSFRKQLWFTKNVPGFAETRKKMKQVKKKRSNAEPPTREFHPTDCFREWEETCGHIFFSEGSVAEPTIVVIKSGHVDFVRRCESPAIGTKILAREREIHFTRLSAGHMFCTLGVFNLPASEPFTARIASETCRYFIATARDVEMLPGQNISKIRESLRKTMRPLLCYSSAFVGLDHLEPETHVRLRPPFTPEPPLKPPRKYSLNPAAPLDRRQVTFRPPQVAWG